MHNDHDGTRIKVNGMRDFHSRQHDEPYLEIDEGVEHEKEN